MKALVVPMEIDHRGGGERVVYKTAEVLADRGIEFDLLTNAYFTDREDVVDTLHDAFGESPEFDEHLDNLYTIESQAVKKLVKLKYKESYQLLKAKKVHEKNDYDLVVFHYSNIHFTPEFEDAEVLYFLGPGPKDQRGLLFDAAKKAYLTPYWLCNKLSRLSSPPPNYSFVSVSRYSMCIFEERFSGIDFDLIYPPVDTEEFRYSGEEKEDRIINFSRITPGKGNRKMVELADRLRDTDFDFIIAGALRESERGYYESIQDEIEERGLEDRLEVRTNLDFDELKQLLKTSKIYVHLAEQDTMPSTPIEAMAAGNSIIVHRSGGPWTDVAEEGRYGEGWSDMDELEQKVRKVAEEDQETERNVERAQDFSEERFKSDISERLDRIL